MQTAISVISMAVGVVLCAVIHSLLLVALEKSSLERNPNYNQIHWIRGTICEHPVFQQKMLNREFRSIADYCYIPMFRWTQNVYFENSDVQKSYIKATVEGIKQHTFDFYHFISPVTGKPLNKMDDNSVIVSEAFAMQAFGTLDVIGQQIRIQTGTYEWNETGMSMALSSVQEKSVTIADVLHTNISDEFNSADIYFKLEDEESCASRKVLLIPSEGCQYQQLCDDIMPIAQELLGEDHGTSIGYTPWSFHSYENGDDWQPDMYITVKSVLYTIVGLILLAAFLGYIRMQIQLFWLRQREIALRTVVGGQMHSLFGMFFMEVCIIMLLTCGAAVLLCRILREQLYENVSLVMRQSAMIWTMQDFELYSVLIIAAILAISLLVVMFAVYQIRRSQTGLALQMKPSNSSTMRKVALGLQMVLSTVFIAVSLLIYEQTNKDTDAYNVDTYNNSFVMSRFSTNLEQKEEKLEKMKNMDGVEGVVSLCPIWRQYLEEEEKPDFLAQRFFIFYCQENDELTNFLDMKVTPVPCSAEKENTVYVTEKLYNAMTDNGSRPAPSISIKQYSWDEESKPHVILSMDCYVAGTVKKIPGSNSNYCDYLILNKQLTTWGEQYLVKAKKGMEAQVCKQLTELRNEGLDEIPRGPVETMKKSSGQSNDLENVVIFIVYVLTIINIISTCSSLYSAVSLDVRRRRKEVSLRKINGAVASDIMKIFAKEYLIIFIICILIALPLSAIVYLLGARGIIWNEGDLGFAWWFLWNYVKVLLIIATITVSTVGGKIHGIMKLKPIEGLKE